MQEKDTVFEDHNIGLRICSSAHKNCCNVMENKLHHFHKLQLYVREGVLKKL